VQIDGGNQKCVRSSSVDKLLAIVKKSGRIGMKILSKYLAY